MNAELFTRGATSDLIFAAVVTFASIYVICHRFLPVRWSFFIAALKATISFVYFAWFEDGHWLLGDDIAYFEKGQAILAMDHNLIRALFDPDIREVIESQASGSHILYGWWNAVGISLFGEVYFAPVFLNLILTAVSGAFLYGILRICEYSERYSQIAVGFYLIHWDMIAWSSFLNLKDNFVLLLTIMNFYYAFKLIHRFSYLNLLLFAAVLSTFWWIRYYLPVFILGAIIIWLTLRWESAKKFVFIPMFLILLYFVFPWGSVTEDRVVLSEILYGVVRYILTPQPWSVDPDYSFLTVPALFHWIALPCTFAGVAIIWRQSRLSQMIFIYTGILCAFYAVVPELQGPRHRVQLEFVFAWAQFAGFLELLRAINLARVPVFELEQDAELLAHYSQQTHAITRI